MLHHLQVKIFAIRSKLGGHVNIPPGLGFHTSVKALKFRSFFVQRRFYYIVSSLGGAECRG
jgi:hypothetical protein